LHREFILFFTFLVCLAFTSKTGAGVILPAAFIPEKSSQLQGLFSCGFLCSPFKFCYALVVAGVSGYRMKFEIAASGGQTGFYPADGVGVVEVISNSREIDKMNSFVLSKPVYVRVAVNYSFNLANWFNG
jgi:hypothetical protein